MEFTLDKLAAFIVEAKLKTYAGDGAEAEAQRPGFKELTYMRGDWMYRDSYAGFFQAPGSEVVYFKNEPIWMMSYVGGMHPQFHGDIEYAKEIFGFLKKALALVDVSAPYRGPAYFPDLRPEAPRKPTPEESALPLLYVCQHFGDIKDFHGIENIYTRQGTTQGKRPVFTQRFMGGLIIPKTARIIV